MTALALTLPSTVAGDTRIRRLATGAVLFVAAIAAIVSFTHIRAVAAAHGQDPLSAFLLPFSVDGTVVASSLAMLRAARRGLDTPRMGRFMLVLAVLTTLACNIAYGLPHGVAGAAISGWPAVAFIGCAELAIGMARKLGTVPVGTQDTSPETTVTTAKPVSKTAPASAVVSAPAARPETGPRPIPSRPRGRSRTRVTELDAEYEFQAELAAGTVPSVRQVKARMRVGHDRAKTLRDHLESVAGERVAA